jgi:translocation and assembly module TamA
MGRRLPALWCALVLTATALPAAAGIKVTVEGVDAEARRNVLIFLSVERYRDSDDVDADMMQRLFNRIDGEVKDGLYPLGYYEPTVAADFHSAGKDWEVIIAIQPGEPVRVRELNVEVRGPGATDPVFATVMENKDRLLRVGMRLNHGTYEDVQGQLTRAAEANGYLDAKFVGEPFNTDRKAHSASINLVLETGPRYSFGRIDIDENNIRPELMRRFLRFREGDPYSGPELLRTQFALDDSLYFSEVEVAPGEPDRESLTIPVTIRTTKSRPTFSIGGGYGTDTGIRGTLGWTDSRVNDRGHRFRAELKASARTRQLESRYDIPIGDPALERMSLEGRITYDRPSDLKTSTTALTPSITRVPGRWEIITSVAATRTTTEKGVEKSTNNLLVPGIVIASVPKDFLGEALFSRALYLELIGSHSALGSDSNFLRLLVQSEHNIDLNYRWHLLLRGEAGASLVNDFGDLPGIYRFFAGGDRSVRGFAYKSLSPLEQVTQDDGSTRLEKTGGRYLLVASAELVRDLPWNLGVATFFDAGNAFNSFHDPLEYAAGVGLRYRLPGVSVGLDVAKPLSSKGSLRLHLNISPKL